MSQQPATNAVMRLRLVAVVRDGDRVLACRDHDTGVWRLPSMQWDAGINPLEAVRELLADRAGVTVSPTLHAPVRPRCHGSSCPTGPPKSLVGAHESSGWVEVPLGLPPGDQQWVSLTSTSAHRPRISSATRRRSGSRHLTVVSSGTAAVSQQTG